MCMCINLVCVCASVHVYKWTLARTCAFVLLYLCMCFARGTEREGRYRANSWPQLHTLRRLELRGCIAATSLQKQLELSPLRNATFSLQPPGGKREVSRRGEGASQAERVRLNVCQKHFHAQKHLVWCFPEKQKDRNLIRNKRMRAMGWTKS